MHDFELHFTEKEKRTQTIARKLKDFYRNQKDVGWMKSTCTTGSQCKTTKKIFGNTLNWIIDHASLNQWLYRLGRHGSVSLCRVERENKMAATYNVLAFKR